MRSATSALGSRIASQFAAMRHHLARPFLDDSHRRKDSVPELQEEIEEQRVLFDSSKNLILITDQSGKIVRATPSAVDIIGHAASAMIGKSYDAFVSPAHRDHVIGEMNLARLKNATRIYDSDFIHKDNHQVALAWSATWSPVVRKFYFIGRDRTEIKHQESIILEQNTKLDLALSNMSQGLIMLDASEKIALTNAQFISMFDLRANQIQPGTPASDLAAAIVGTKLLERESRDGWLTQFAGKKLCTGHYVEQQELSDGRTINITLSRLDSGGMLGTFEDITALQSALKHLAVKNQRLEEQELELKTKHLQLDVALNNMSHGLSMHDASGRLALCNDQFVEMYDLARDVVQVGMSISDVMRLRIDRGMETKENMTRILSALRKCLADANGGKFECELQDGRTISISCELMSGGGWVVTHQDVSNERRREAKIAHMARHDALTDLPNRFVLGEVLNSTLADCKRGKKAALFFMDLDKFKTVNDTLGHAVGDKLLLAVAERLRSCVRDTDTVARLGGDEFAVVQRFIQRPEDAAGLAKRLIAALGAPYEIDGRAITRGVSIGIAIAPDNGHNAEELLRNSDLALYRAKELGRGDYNFFEPVLDARMQKHRDIEDELRKTVDGHQFELHYQPLISIEAMNVVGFESLLRWRHPERGLIPPLDFIAIAEETGLIVRIGQWALLEACRAAVRWDEHVRIAVNLSAVQFRRDGIVQVVKDALAETGLDPRRLDLEITESLLLEASEAVLGKLHQLRDLGVGISLDDFGTGYSSLSYLQNFPFTRIKIDRSFIRNLSNTDSSRAIVKAMVAIAKAVDMKITAEGIETEQQLSVAVECGCTEFQGYFFSRPRPSEDVPELLALPIRKLVTQALYPKLELPAPEQVT